MNFKATDEQVKQIAVNAVIASSPIGMGHLHFDGTQEFDPSMFEVTNNSLHLDYVQGRMVKLNLWKNADGTWKSRDEVRLDYQSWGSKYPTFKDLVTSVDGVEVI